MAKKKEKTIEELLDDLFVKLKNIYNKDIFVIDSTYILGGDQSNESLYGDFICILEADYVRAMKSVLGDHRYVLISDIKAFKENPSGKDAFYYYDEVTKEVERYFTKQKRIHDTFDMGNSDWCTLATMSESELGKVFTDNRYVQMQPENPEYPKIIIGKKLFPMVTLKNLSNVYYKFIHDGERGLYCMCVDFHFTHFRVNYLYYFLPIIE